MKRIMAMVMMVAGISMVANAQTLLYEWNFTNNITGTLTNMSPSYTDPSVAGTGNLVVTNILGNAAGVFAYFTNGAGVGPGLSGPGGSTAGAYFCAGQSYGGGGNAAVALCQSNVNLGTLYKFTITYWFQMGPSMVSRFPRFAMFSQTRNYDEGQFNGVAGSVNGWNTTVSPSVATRLQNDLGGASGAANNQSALLPAAFTNVSGVNGIYCDGATWYFMAEQYDGTKSSGQWTSWLGTTTTNVVQVDLQTLNFLGINFTTNATLQIGNSPNGARGFSDGQVADLRIYRGFCSSNNLEAIRTLSGNFVDDGSGNNNTPPAFNAQPSSGKNYVGGARTFTVDATGLTPLSYQWKSNNLAILGATNTTLTLSNLQLSANGASILCTVTNGLAATNSATVILNVTAPTAGTYEYAVVTNRPYIFWRLNEQTNSDGSAVNISDYMNGFDGTAADPANMSFTVTNLSAPLYPGFASTNTGIEVFNNGNASRLNMAILPTYTNGMTICGWIRAFTSPPNSHGIIYAMTSGNTGPNTTGNGYGLWFNGTGTDVNGNTGGQLSYNWNGAGINPTPYASGLIVPSNEWTFVALTIDPAGTNATLYMGSQSGGFQMSIDDPTVTGDIITNATGFNAPILLGRSPYSFWEQGQGSYFGGNNIAFNDVAIYYTALSSNTISNLFVIGAGVPRPTLTGVPDGYGNLILTWNFGTLQEATAVTGPYTDVAGPPTSPAYVIIDVTAPQHFYRVRN